MLDRQPHPAVTPALLGAGTLFTALAWAVALPWIGAAPDTTDLATGRVLSGLLLWGGLLGLLLWWLDRQAPRWGRRLTLIAFGLALLMRLPLLLTTPLFSDDLWRYLWEGKIQALGGNPFVTSPLAFAQSEVGAALAQTNPHWAHVNHPEISAIYPPLAQMIFFVVVSLWESPFAMKLAMVLFDLLVGHTLLALLRERNAGPHLCLAWLWSPFVCFEVAGAGHLDAVAALFILGWLAGIGPGSRWRESGGAVALGAAVLVKLIPVVLLPVALRWQRHRWTLLLCLIAIALPYLLYTRVGEPGREEPALPWSGGAATEDFTRALRTYEAKWRHNDGLHWLVFEGVILGSVALTPPDEADGSPAQRIAAFERRARRGEAVHRENEAALAVSKAICHALFLGGLALLLWRCSSPTSCALWVLGLFLLLRPTIHPWYFLLVLPLAILERRWSWWVLSLLSLGTYVTVEHHRQTGEWSESTMAWAIQWGVFFSCLAWEQWRASRTEAG